MNRARRLWTFVALMLAGTCIGADEVSWSYEYRGDLGGTEAVGVCITGATLAQAVDTIAVPDEIDGLPVTEIAAGTVLAGADVSQAALTLPASLEYVGSGAFTGASRPRTITSRSVRVVAEDGGLYQRDDWVANGVTQQVYRLITVFPRDIVTFTARPDTYVIGAAAFRDCAQLREVSLPDTVEEIEDTGAYSLGTCIAGVAMSKDLSGAVPSGATLKVTGLPSGLSFKNNIVSGTPKTPGVYSVTWTLTGREPETVSLTVYGYPVYVHAVPLTDGQALPADCTATGTGTNAVGATVKLAAKAGRGYVFGHWRCFNIGDGEPADPGLATGAASTSFKVTAAMIDADHPETSGINAYAYFATAAEDAASLSITVTNCTVSGAVSFPVTVASCSMPKVTVTGLPKGLSFNATTLLITGTPTAPGVYTVTVKATNTSDTRGVTSTFTLTVPNLHDDMVPVRDSYVVGVDTLDFSELLTGATLTVTGLPKGLTYNAKTGTVTGSPTAPGTSTVYFTRKIGKVSYVSTATFVIYGVYVTTAVDASGDGTGKVTGTGYYAAGGTVKLTATADKNCVFAGWYDGTNALATVSDPRTAANTVVLSGAFVDVSAGDAYLTVLGRFVTKETDAASLSIAVTNCTVSGAVSFPVTVASFSTPKVTVTGLPKGLSFNAKTLLVTGTPTAPGVYTVTVKATNTSNTKGVTDTFTLTVPNLHDDMVPVRDSYVVGVDTLDFSELLTGATLTVTGLPKGLTYNAKTGTVTGSPTAPGSYTVYFTRKIGKVSYVSTSTFVIYGVYVTTAVDASGDGTGKVTGTGYYAAGGTVKLTATADKNCVFAGWYDGTNALATVSDPRTAANTVVLSGALVDVSAGDAYLTVLGRFVTKTTDAASLSIAVTNRTVSGAVSFPVTVASCSMPKVTVTGLPKGLSFNATTLLITGTPTAPGVYTVTVKATNTSNTKGVTSTFDLVVYGVYVTTAVDASGDGTGKVSGTGYYAAGGTVKLTATADKNCVFAGWYDGTNALATVSDPRTAANTVVLSGAFVDVSAGDAYLTVLGRFVTKETDAASLSIAVTNRAVSGAVSFPVTVASCSMPKVTVTGLPKGLSFNAKTLLITGTPTAPGVYTVTVKATNTSNTKGVTDTFTLKVPDLTDANDLLTQALVNGPDDAPYAVAAGVTEHDELPVLLSRSGAKVTVSGLPTGLTYNATANAKTGAAAGTITGVATKAGSFLVTVKVGTATSTFTIAVAALPDWMVGTFEFYENLAGSETTAPVNRFTLTVDARGAVTVKDMNGTSRKGALARRLVSEDGVRYVFESGSALTFASTDVGGVVIGMVEGEDILGYQNAWKRAANTVAAPTFANNATATTAVVLSGETYAVTLKFGKSGAVTGSLAQPGLKAVSFSATLLPFAYDADTCRLHTLLISSAKIGKVMTPFVLAPVVDESKGFTNLTGDAVLP